MCGVGLSGLFSCVSACDAVREPVLREGAGGSDGMGWLAAVGAGWGGPSGKRGEERGQVGPTGWGAAWGGARWGGPGGRGARRGTGGGESLLGKLTKPKSSIRMVMIVLGGRVAAPALTAAAAPTSTRAALVGTADMLWCPDSSKRQLRLLIRFRVPRSAGTARSQRARGWPGEELQAGLQTGPAGVPRRPRRSGADKKEDAA